MEEHQHKYYEPETPRFFKIILHDTLQAGKLSFPKSFVRHHGRILCLSKVYLRVTCGDVWEMGLHREEDGGIWLHNGWQEFVEFYNIKFGYFLVFGYLGSSEFQVFIFDKTTSEIKYPCNCKYNKEQSADVGSCLLSVKPEIDKNDAEMVVDCGECPIDASNCVFSTNREKNTNCLGKKSGDDDYVNGELETARSRNNSIVRAEAIIRAKAFKSPNPHFQILMQETYVNKSALHLPGRFIMQHIGQKNCYLRLCVPCGKFWAVTCRFRMNGNQPEARVQSGWRNFVQDNDLVVGDVCIFELIDSVKLHFQVTIFRAAKDRNFSNRLVKSEIGECIGRRMSPRPSCHKESYFSVPYAATSSRTAKYPSFHLVMTEARLKRRNVPIQAQFLKHFKRRTQMVTLDFAGRLWHVKVCFCQQFGRAILSLGWSKFARENSLQVGDICVFELIKKEGIVLRVSIHKGCA